MSSTARMTPRRSLLLWWVGTAIAAVTVLLGAFAPDLSDIPPASPYDNTESGHAEQWLFLEAASRLVPEGSTFTVNGADSTTEMSLYMISVGLLPHATAVPATYYGSPVATSGSARFLLDFRGGTDSDHEAVQGTRVRGGIVADQRPESP